MKIENFKSLKNIIQDGFSIIELLLVLIIIGIFSKIAVPRFSTLDSLTVDSQTQKLTSSITSAKTRAMSSGISVCFVTSSTAYSFCNCNSTFDNCGTTIFSSVQLESNATLSPATTLVFNNIGSPFAVVAQTLTKKTTTQAYTLTGGSFTKTITVSPYSGEVSVSP